MSYNETKTREIYEISKNKGGNYMMSKMFKKVLAIMLVAILMVPTVAGVEAQAAAKPSLSKKSITIGVGSYGEVNGYVNKTKNRYAVSIKNAVKGATYSFASKNTKIATVKKSGNTGYITGVKAGTTTITVKQKLKGKTTTVGSCKVVVKASVAKASYVAKEGVCMGTNVSFGGNEVEPIVKINYVNPDAKYTYYCSNSNFKMTQLKVDSSNLMGKGYFSYGQKYTAKKAGTYTVTVKETYKNKTRTIGTVKVKVVEPKVRETEEIFVGSGIYLSTLASDFSYVPYIVDWAEDDVLVAEEAEMGDYYLKGVKAGTAVLNFYYKEANGTRGALMGSCTVTVKEFKVTDIQVEAEVKLAVYDEGKLFTVVTDPEEAAELVKVTCTSSDESVISISEDGYYYADQPGTATITITAGDITKEVKVTVVDEDASSEDAEEE